MVKGSSRQQAAAAGKKATHASTSTPSAPTPSSSSSSTSSSSSDSATPSSDPSLLLTKPIQLPASLFDTAPNSQPLTLPPSLLQSAALALPASSIMQQHAQAGVGGVPSSVSPPSGIGRFATQPVSANGGMVPPPSNFTRQLSRLPSSNLHQQTFQTSDWRTGVSVEERINIRRKLREAYFKHCPSYEQLLDTVTAVDEELLFSCSSNRIDYFKSSIDWDARIQLKRQQLKGTSSASSSSSPPAQSNDKKRTGSEADLSGSSVSLLEVGINNSDLLRNNGGQTLDLPPVSLLQNASAANATLRSPSKDTASSLVALGTGTALPATKKQRN